MSLSRPVALVGLPGAGKTRVGRLLAERFGCRFSDSDAEVERHTGMRISAIFARQGEGRFRILEREAIARLLRAGPQIIALGGGAVEDKSTRDALLAQAVTIWLDVPHDVLLKRLARDRRRPLLQGEDRGERLRELSDRRLPLYAQADLRIVAARSSEMADKVAAAILESDIAGTSVLPPEHSVS